MALAALLIAPSLTAQTNESAAGGNGGFGDALGGCQGGTGGPGGSGAPGGGGAGGVSAGVLYKGTKPTLTNTTPQLGRAGGKGIGGKPGVNDGVDERAGPEIEAP